MATATKIQREGIYKTVIRFRDVNGKKRTVTHSLKTKNPQVAEKRHFEVVNIMNLIASGETISMSWQNGTDSTIIGRSLNDYKNDYIKYRKNEQKKPKTIENDETTLNRFIDFYGKYQTIEKIDYATTNQFIEYLKQFHDSKEGINMRLRVLNTFFNWLRRLYELNHLPKVEQLRVSISLPRYLSDSKFTQICAEVDDFHKMVFTFYRQYGLRLREVIHSRLEKNFLLIDAEGSKGVLEREIELSPTDVNFYMYMRNSLFLDDTQPRKRSQHNIEYFSNVFRQAVKDAGIEGHKFHDLRHTFGVRTWLQTGDIYWVQKQMGHAKISTTEHYTKFSVRRLQYDFPTLSNRIQILRGRK